MAQPLTGRRRPAARRAATALGLALGVLGLRALAVSRQGPRHERFWRALAALPAPPGAIRLVALGDSTVQAIGATRPLDGLVGRARDHLREVTGRPVHVVNLGVAGATVSDVVTGQLPYAFLDTADVVLVSVSSSDVARHTPPARYASALRQLLDALPAARAVLSDVPLQPCRGDYQRVLAALADRRGIARADFAGAFLGPGRRLDVFAGDLCHLNSRGYAQWFTAFRPGLDAIAARLHRPPAAAAA